MLPSFRFARRFNSKHLEVDQRSVAPRLNSILCSCTTVISGRSDIYPEISTCDVKFSHRPLSWHVSRTRIHVLDIYDNGYDELHLHRVRARGYTQAKLNICLLLYILNTKFDAYDNNFFEILFNEIF